MAIANCRILCIDDHHDSAEMLRLVLSQEDYDVVTATSMAEAIELAQDEVFDLFVLDRRLPDGTGIELCRQLNQSCQAKHRSLDRCGTQITG
jgi:DNA-binding response OmpR family regulator